jgi:molybdopterin synthase sulfur carrier subunit
MRILYFAWLRQRIGLAEEEIERPAGVDNVAALLDWLRGRGPNFATALADLSVVRVAVNQEYVANDCPLRGDEEVALFPPVTGG